MRLRSHLIVLVLAAVLPLIAFGVLIVRQDLAAQRETLDRGMRDTARALSLAVDSEVKASLAVLQTLAASRALDDGDLQTFYDIVTRAMRDRPGAYVVLFDTSGKALLNSSRAYGVSLPNPLAGTRPPGAAPQYPGVPLGGGDPVKSAITSGAPVISDLFVSLVTAGPRIGLDIPVARGGAPRYVLEMSIDAAEFTRLLAAQHAPADSVLALVDRRGVAIARTVDAPGRVGRPLAPELARQIAAADSGSGVGHTSEGMPVYHVFVRSPITGWTTSLSVARAVALAPFSDALAVFAAGAALAVVLGLAAALVIGKRVTRPISRLTDAAGTLARGEAAAVDVSAVSELQELHAALVSAGASARQVTEAQAASRAKDEFLAMLSHELRNPLAALTSAAHVLKLADPSSEAAGKARRIVERQTKQMSRLVGDLLDVSRITLGKLSLERERFDLAEAVTRLFNIWRSSGRFERHQVSLETASVWVDADWTRIEQITANLLDNAVKFTPAGRAVAVSVRPQGEAALLCVADEGPGIEPQAAERIFELFVQATPRSEGLGVGLALVKRLVQMHGGTVAADRRAATGGALFTVRLPAVARPIEQAGPAVAQAATGRSVLIVDDNEDARLMLAALLRMEGHEVRVAADGRDGLALAGANPPDVALIDVRLPDMEGYQVARRLRAVYNAGRMRLVALSGLGRLEDQERSRQAGFDAHLVKPVSVERLKQVLAKLA